MELFFVIATPKFSTNCFTLFAMTKKAGMEGGKVAIKHKKKKRKENSLRLTIKITLIKWENTYASADSLL